MALEFLKEKGAVAIEVNAPEGVAGLAQMWEKAGLKPFARRFWKKLN